MGRLEHDPEKWAPVFGKDHAQIIEPPHRRSRAVTVHQLPNTLDLEAFWMPFTANRQFKETPRLFASAEGMYYTSVDGRKVIDGSAGLWCVNAGHGRKPIAAAVERQLMNLDFAPSFQMGHPIAFDFARWDRSEEHTSELQSHHDLVCRLLL